MKDPVELVSAGGVACRRTVDTVEVALVAVGPENRWQLPKGIIDPGETIEEAAVREVREEAGIECTITGSLGAIDYSFTASYDGPPTHYRKQVHFFMMEYVSGDVAEHDHEVEDARWFPIEEASRRLAFESERKVVEKAMGILFA